jgi:hypothetical protein
MGSLSFVGFAGLPFSVVNLTSSGKNYRLRNLASLSSRENLSKMIGVGGSKVCRFCDVRGAAAGPNTELRKRNASKRLRAFKLPTASSKVVCTLLPLAACRRIRLRIQSSCMSEQAKTVLMFTLPMFR